VLLTTSGSTSTPKLVKLSKVNLASNCYSICRSLPITHDDVASFVLSMSYSYGLSVINTHLAVGATLSDIGKNITSSAHWLCVKRHGVTSIAMVPTHCFAIQRLSIDKLISSGIRYATFAGGKLSQDNLEFIKKLRMTGVKCYVMYGQTEATARMSVLNDADFDKKCGSVGTPIENGSFTLLSDNELSYVGPNVFHGYASSYEHLLKERHYSQLNTGDIGVIDEDGFVWITGRKKRIVKINSTRLSLDEIELSLSTAFPTNRFVCVDDDLGSTLVIAHVESLDTTSVRSHLRDVHDIHCNVVFCELSRFVLNANHKIDYQATKVEVNSVLREAHRANKAS